MSRLFRVYRDSEPQPPETPKPVRPKVHHVSLRLPHWLFCAVQEDAANKGIKSVTGYITLLLSETYGLPPRKGE